VPETSCVQNNHNDDNNHCNGNCGRPAAVPEVILPAKAVLVGRSIFVRHRVPSYLARPPAVCGGLLLQPPVYHGTSVKFSIFPRSIKGLCRRLDASGINGDRPQIRLDPCTNSVADASVLHNIILRPNPKLYNVRRDGCGGFLHQEQALLADLNSGVAAQISYQSRETEGTQTPIETLDRGKGCCRDLAVLLIEAARNLGFGTPVVTVAVERLPRLTRDGQRIFDKSGDVYRSKHKLVRKAPKKRQSAEVSDCCDRQHSAHRRAQI